MSGKRSAKPEPHPLPQSGGSYERLLDGSLRLRPAATEPETPPPAVLERPAEKED